MLDTHRWRAFSRQLDRKVTEVGVDPMLFSWLLLGEQPVKSQSQNMMEVNFTTLACGVRSLRSVRSGTGRRHRSSCWPRSDC